MSITQVSADLLDYLNAFIRLAPPLAVGFAFLFAVGEVTVLLLGVAAMVTGACIGLGLSRQTATRWVALPRCSLAVQEFGDVSGYPVSDGYSETPCYLIRGIDLFCAETQVGAYSQYQEVGMHGSDEELVAQWQSGDNKAVDELFERFSARIHKFHYTRTGNWSLAWDLAQETFLKLIRAKRKINPSRPFAPYLFRIALNTRISWFRTTARWAKVFTPIGNYDGAGPNNVENVLAVERAVEALPRRLRTIHELRMQGFSNAEVADITKLSNRTIVTANTEIQRFLRNILTQPAVKTNSTAPSALPQAKKINE